MRNLLSAELYRLLRSKLLYIGIATAVITEVYSLIINRNSIQQFDGGLEDSFFIYSMLLVIVTPAFCGLFLGVEYSSGTLRNKIIAGIGRYQIYIVNLWIAAISSFLFALSAILPGIAFGLPFVASFQMDSSELIWYLACSIGIALASASFCTMIASLISHRSLGLAVGILITFSLLFFGQYLFEALNEPEYVQPTERIIQDGRVFYHVDPNAPKISNPDYPDGAFRIMCQFLWNFLPMSQCFQVAFGGVESPAILLLNSALFTLVTTSIGIFLFQQKDIK